MALTPANDRLAHALAYRAMGWSVIPIGTDKRPLLRWQEFQERIATEDEVMAWFTRWPTANVGIVTGAISGLTVVDIDTDEGRVNLEDYIPSKTRVPTAKTQRGGTHLFFKYHEGLGNRVGVIPGTDLRSEGGYVVAPPSKGMAGAYEWVHGLDPGKVRPLDLPEAYVRMMLDPATGKIIRGDFRTTEAFTEGRRNDTIFHAAVALAKGGMQDPDELFTYVSRLAGTTTPPLPEEEVKDITKHALEHITRKSLNVAQEVRDWVLGTHGDFSLQDMYKDLGIGEKADKALGRQTIQRLVESGKLARHGTKDGRYRKVEPHADTIDILGAPTTPIGVKLPFDLHEVVNIYPGNIIVVAGEPNVGKTSFMIETLKLNMMEQEVDYYSSEMGGSEFKVRLMAHEDLSLKDWRFNPYERSENFSDVVRPGAISLIDYMELGDDFYRVGKYLAEIHTKLNGTGLAIVAVQKGRGKDVGRGGDFGLEKPRLYVTLNRDPDLTGGVAKIVKAKNWAGTLNPNGKIMPFKIIGGWKFIYDRPWRYPEDEETAKAGLIAIRKGR
jgi:hypothetical protein